MPGTAEELPEEPSLKPNTVDIAPSYFHVKPILRPSEHTPPHTPPEGGASGSTRPSSKRVSFSAPSYDPPPSIPAAAAPASGGLRKWLMQKVPRGRKSLKSSHSASDRSSSRENNEVVSVASSPANSVFAFNRPGVYHFPRLPRRGLQAKMFQFACQMRPFRIQQV